jgi:hypothetical protein
MRMPIKLVELNVWLDEREETQAPAEKDFGLGDGRVAPDASSHLMGMLLEALTNPGALAPLTEDLALWIAACDHAQTCAMCRSGLAALAGVGDTPDGALGALLAHTALDGASAGSGRRTPRRLRPAPDAAALASYVTIIRADGESAAATQLPAVATHLRGCPLCRRDVVDALAALQSLAPDAP